REAETALCITAKLIAERPSWVMSGPASRGAAAAHVRFAPIATQLLHGIDPPLSANRVDIAHVCFLVPLSPTPDIVRPRPAAAFRDGTSARESLERRPIRR